MGTCLDFLKILAVFHIIWGSHTHLKHVLSIQIICYTLQKFTRRGWLAQSSRGNGNWKGEGSLLQPSVASGQREWCEGGVGGHLSDFPQSLVHQWIGVSMHWWRGAWLSLPQESTGEGRRGMGVSLCLQQRRVGMLRRGLPPTPLITKVHMPCRVCRIKGKGKARGGRGRWDCWVWVLGLGQVRF